MNVKHLIATCLLSILLILQANYVFARLLPRFRGAGRVVSRGIYVGARLRSDHQALEVNFGNLSRAKSVTYTLTYQTNGVDQGVSGSLDLSSGDYASRELLFGTCSNGVCRYHSNITGMKFEIQTLLNSGKTTIRRFRIRV